jgi:hypothetical protein
MEEYYRIWLLMCKHVIECSPAIADWCKMQWKDSVEYIGHESPCSIMIGLLYRCMLSDSAHSLPGLFDFERVFMHSVLQAGDDRFAVYEMTLADWRKARNSYCHVLGQYKVDPYHLANKLSSYTNTI